MLQCNTHLQKNFSVIILFQQQPPMYNVSSRSKTQNTAIEKNSDSHSLLRESLC